MGDSRKALARYGDILGGSESPYYLKARCIPVKDITGMDPEAMWDMHDSAISELRNGAKGHCEKPDFSLLDLKLAIARELLKSCILCERRCGVDRTAGQRGHCRVLEARIASEFMHLGEEPELVPSYTIFFSGCTFDCVFCQNWDISQRVESGQVFPAKSIAALIQKRARQAKNVNWVGGDPTSSLAYVLEVLAMCSEAIPQVWNSNMYLTRESMRLLDGIVDVYLTDFKFGNSECARRYSCVDDYWEITTRNHLLAGRQAEIIVRHLVLPGHVECCSKPILKWVADNFQDNVRVNVMAQYRPHYNAFKYPEINRGLDRFEFAETRAFAENLGLNLVD